MNIGLALLAISLLAASGCQGTGTARGVPASAEETLRRVDLDHARFVQIADEQALSALVHPAYTAHLPNGRIVDRAQTLALVENGASATERFERMHDRVVIAGTTGIVVGADRLETPPSLARNGERTRRYTNVYVHQNGHWQLLARHFHFQP